MFAYIARQPILDANMDVQAYELLFRDGKNNCFPDIQPDEATSKILTNNYLTLGLEEVAGHKTAYINFHKDTLLNDFTSVLNPEHVVVEIVETIPTTREMVEACKRIKDKGYTLALDDHNFDPRWDVFLPYIDIVKVDTHRADIATMQRELPRFQQANVKLVAEKVETRDQFDAMSNLGFDLYQGYFFARPQVIKNRNLPTSKLAMLQLLQETSNSHFDMQRVAGIFERDVGLTYMLMRFINNPMVNKRYEITSIKHALNYLGEVELKKFIALVSLAKIGEDRPFELLHMSLVRAKFCELLSLQRKDNDNPPKGFLVGLFSLLDAMLEQDTRSVVARLPIDKEIKEALLGNDGRLRRYLLTARAFESANWLNLIRLSKALEVDQRTLHHLFNQAIVWGNGIRQVVSNHYPKAVV